MTTSPASPVPIEPLEAFPLPPGAIVLPPPLWQQVQEDGERELRRLALAALRQAMDERELHLPLGPETDPTDPSRLLALNRFAVQLAVTGMLSDEVAVPAAPWRDAATAPQLLLVAAIDPENGVVGVPGVLTASEVIAAVGDGDQRAERLVLPISAFKGGIERLFTLTALLDPAALPRQALRQQPARPAVRVRDWLEGLLPPALGDLGAELVPVTAGAFRQGGATADSLAPGALAVLSIPLGLTTAGTLVTGDAAQACLERFRLLLIPTAQPPSAATAPATDAAERLTLQLVGELEGDLLPDGLLLSASQGSRRSSVSSANSTQLELELPAAPDLIEVTLTPPDGTPLVLPPLQLPAG
ncbi:hypothetical protein [Cyanobium sp. CH-040]|uniref:hypothetical protein n=1 Tax=Cyanobium sp. CH-040 TaxID=2823708 RepID=UPI0020CB7A4D|nr:hypothetical protein [Cyanobium sp. CH-040]MCP9928833.1 hypothetical protein [Cyanobium sp. CH-040]